MKHHKSMTRPELYDYVVDLKGMIANLQGQLARALTSNAALYAENKRLKGEAAEKELIS